MNSRYSDTNDFSCYEDRYEDEYNYQASEGLQSYASLVEGEAHASIESILLSGASIDDIFD